MKSKIKYAIAAAVILASLLTAPLFAQDGPTSTNPPSPPLLSGPVWTALSFGSGASTNWGFAAYGIASSAGDKYGAGLAGMYKLNDFVVPTLRLDYYDGRVWMPSASLNLQTPVTLFGKLTAIPFAFTGLATPLSGKGGSDNTAVGIAGLGMAVRIVDHFDIVADVEKWSGFKNEQIRFGIVYKIGW